MKSRLSGNALGWIRGDPSSAMVLQITPTRKELDVPQLHHLCPPNNNCSVLFHRAKSPIGLRGLLQRWCTSFFVGRALSLCDIYLRCPNILSTCRYEYDPRIQYGVKIDWWYRVLRILISQINHIDIVGGFGPISRAPETHGPYTSTTGRQSRIFLTSGPFEIALGCKDVFGISPAHPSCSMEFSLRLLRN